MVQLDNIIWPLALGGPPDGKAVLIAGQVFHLPKAVTVRGAGEAGGKYDHGQRFNVFLLLDGFPYHN